MKIVLIDNYDSFTFNIFQQLRKFGGDVSVIKNDEISVDDLSDIEFDRIVISPGPSIPKNAGITLNVINKFCSRVPIFGICLGHQAICESFGGKIIKTSEPLHGYKKTVLHDRKGVFNGIKQGIKVGLYHSLEVDRNNVPDCLKVTATSDTGVVMGLRHRDYDVESVQFHPDSVLTETGDQMISNWMNI